MNADAETFISGRKRPYIMLAAGAAAALGGALISQYGFGYHPCVLCLYQRMPYAILLALSALLLFTPFEAPLMRRMLLFAALLMLIGAVVAMFHVGVEQKWWPGTDGCVGADGADTLDALRAAILAAPVVRCDEAAFVFLGLSMAAWNVLYSLALFFYALYEYRTDPARRPAIS